MRRTVSRIIPALLVLVALTGPAPLLALECTPEKPSCCCPGGCGGEEPSRQDTMERPCCGDANGVPVPEPAAVESVSPAPAPPVPAEVAGVALRPILPRGIDGTAEAPGATSAPVPLFTLHASLLI